MQYAVAYSTDLSYSFLEVHRKESSKISKTTKDSLQNCPFFSSVDLFCVLVDVLKNSVMEDEYSWEQTRLTNLISKQPEFCQKSLTDMLKFLDNREYRWIRAFRSNTHNISRSSLAKMTLVSTKAGREKNVSLLDAAYCNIVESARFEVKWQIPMNGEQSFRCWPSPLIFDEKNELRQIARASQFLRETNEIEDGYGYEILLSSSQPPKARWRRLTT